jgi:outer membrane protein
MKKVFTTVSLFLFLAGAVSAQRFVYVDTEYILKNIPEYNQAQKKIDDIAEEWRKEIDRKYADIDKLYKVYQAEQVLMPEDMKIKKQKEIEDKEKEAKDFQKQKFGFEGELFQKKQELIKPIQDKIYNEIQKMATEKTIDFVFDKASGVSILFANNRYDRSDDILKALGITPSAGK